MLPGYTSLEKLHESDETIIHRALRIEDQRLVILKSPRSEYPPPRVLARLRHEFNLLHGLDLRGVIRVYGLEPRGDSLTLVEEDFAGQPLDVLLAAGRIDRGLALEIAVGLAGALAAVHAVPIVHRDIKPQNILVRPATGEVELIDFSLATRLSRELQGPDAPAALAGTLAYMSPEQTGRMNRVVDRRSDLYSLGVTLHELFTGVLPFPETDPLELIHAHVTRAPTPLHERDPGLPRALSAVVTRLLAKAAEDHYQSARGLQADLEECREQWRASGDIAEFPLGRRDRDSELRVPQRLYGRADAAATLLAALARARGGAAELVLLAGPAGVGKSALVQEVFRGSVLRGAAFVRGKSDQFERHGPYAPIVQALRQRMRELLSEPPDRLELRRRDLLAALGPNARLLIDLIPELGVIVGPQPEPAALGPSEAKNRFNLVIQSFVQALATAEQPLVLLLDDLQWADPASLTLLETLLLDPGANHLLILGAYREHEVDAGHPLLATLGALRRAGVALGDVTLSPLAGDHVEALLADTLGCTAAEAAPLAREVLAKTRGNPFFINQFLAALVKDGLLRLDADAGAWRWDLPGIAAAQVTANVVEFMADKLRELDADTQRLLQLAAAIGHEFELGTLAALSGRSEPATAARLWSAIREGLLDPIAGDYHYLLGDSTDAAARVDAAFHVRLRFLHDRVQQAAYSLIPAEQRPRLHLEIGRRLLAAGGRERLFDVVNHLNIGLDLIADPMERRELARLDLDAARRAKAATAYQTAATQAHLGLRALGEDGWAVDHALGFALASECAECEYLSGQIEPAEALFAVLVARARTPAEHVQVQTQRISLYTTLGRSADAFAAGRAGLRALGVELPGDEPGWLAALAAETAEMAELRAGRDIAALLDGPPLDDPRLAQVTQLLVELAISAFGLSPVLWAALIVRIINIALRHGHSDLTPYGFLAHGFGLANQGLAADACAFGRLGLALHERYHNSALTCRMYAVYGVYQHLRDPLREALPLLRRAIQAGLETGDTTYTSMATNHLCTTRMGLGDELAAVAEEVDRFIALLRRIHDRVSLPMLTITRQKIACLAGRTRHPRTLDDERFDELAFLDECQGAAMAATRYYYHLTRLQVLYLHGDVAGALATLEPTEALRTAAFSVYYSAEFSLFALLVRSAAIPAATPAAREVHLAEMERFLAQLTALAADCPANYEHQRLLGAAELAHRRGRDDEAVGLHEQAVAGAQEQGFPQLAAIASELAADVHQARRRPALAHLYLREAYHGFLRWGATVKAARLAARHPELLDATSDRRAVDVVTTTTTRHLTVDVAAVLRAAQALAGERALGNLVELLMRGVLQAAGAQRGLLLVPRDGGLVLEAAASTDAARVAVDLGQPLTEETPALAAAVRFVARTRETLVVGDATADLRFAGEAYVARARPRSLLCLALQHQGQMTAVLYLENNAVTHAFTAERVELLRLLASQAATAMENARLYADLQRSADALRRANEGLEAEVLARTTELRAAAAELRGANAELLRRSEDLRGVNERLQAELTGRQQAVQQREALQQEVIAAQRARLAEMSTPLMPISESIVAMPLIGSMDAERAQQVLEAALTGAQRHRARVVILDITGMQQHDSQVASVLVTTAGALRLLGAQAVLTGVGPDLAALLAGQNLDLRGLVTRGTLQAGIAYALAREDAGARAQLRR